MHSHSQQIETPHTENGTTQSPLFRPEVMASRNSQWMGAIRLAQPASAWFVASLAIAIAGLLIGFIFFGSIYKKARVTGITTPIGGSLTITAANSGTLVHRLVSEGDKVAAGQPLFELSMERQGKSGDVSTLLQQQFEIRRQTLETERRAGIARDQEKRRAIDAHLSNLTSQEEQLDQEISLAQHRKSLAQETLAKFETLQTNGFVSSTQAQQKQEELIDLSSHLSSLIRAKAQLQASRIGLKGDKAALDADLATTIAELDSANARLRAEVVQNQDRNTTLITAPEAGVVTTITNQPGQSVINGQVLATLIPVGGGPTGAASADLEVHLYAPSRTAGFVALGQKVLIRYQAYPYQKFGLYEGDVVDVSKTPLAANELPANVAGTILSNAQQSVPGFKSSEALYRIKVRPARQTVAVYGKAQPLRPGMTLEADILQDKRRIWEWILEPILAVAHR